MLKCFTQILFWFYILKLQDAHIQSLFYTVLYEIFWSKWFIIDNLCSSCFGGNIIIRLP